MTDTFEIFAIAPPGLEQALLQQARAAGIPDAIAVPGGVQFHGSMQDAWRANLLLRGASRVLIRVASFRAMHLAQLDKRARKLPWGEVLRPDVPVKVEATCRKSRIYHGGAARQRIERAIAETLGAPLADDAPITVKARIEDDLCTISLDTSGEPLHRRGFKQFVGKAPMRETLASLFLTSCRYDGTEPVLDPMCGSGTFVIEAAEIARGLAPGRDRAFAFEQLAGFDAQAWAAMKAEVAPVDVDLMFHGSDRDAGAVAGAQKNADRAGVAGVTRFENVPLGALGRPDGPPGLVMVNPPYGARIGNKKLLFALHGTLGARLREQFTGWRVGIVTSDGGLAKATGLEFAQVSPPVPHGGLKVKLYQTGPL